MCVFSQYFTKYGNYAYIISSFYKNTNKELSSSGRSGSWREELITMIQNEKGWRLSILGLEVGVECRSFEPGASLDYMGEFAVAHDAGVGILLG